MGKILKNTVIDYLLRHPDFFVENKQLLLELDIPHDVTGNVTSMIERQARLQRNEIIHLKGELKNINDKYSKLHEVIKSTRRSTHFFLDKNSPKLSYKTFSMGIKKHFSVDKLQTIIFMEPPLTKKFRDSGMIITSPRDKRKTFFIELFNRKKALCGILQTELMTILFGQDSDALSSTVIYPITSQNPNQNWTGLIAIASIERDRYRMGPEIELFTFFCDIFTYTIDKIMSNRLAVSSTAC